MLQPNITTQIALYLTDEKIREVNSAALLLFLLWLSTSAWKKSSELLAHCSLSVYIQCASSFPPSLRLSPSLSQRALHWHTKGFFQHVFRSLALFKTSCVSGECGLTEDVFKPALTVMKCLRYSPGAAAKRTVVRVLTENHESMCVSLCLWLSQFANTQTTNRGLFDV